MTVPDSDTRTQEAQMIRQKACFFWMVRERTIESRSSFADILSQCLGGRVLRGTAGEQPVDAQRDGMSQAGCTRRGVVRWVELGAGSQIIARLRVIFFWIASLSW